MQAGMQTTHVSFMCSTRPATAQMQHYANGLKAAATTYPVCKSIMDVLVADSTTCAPFIVAGGLAVSHSPANNRASTDHNEISLEGTSPADNTAGATAIAVAGPMPWKQISTDTLRDQLEQRLAAAKDAAACKQRKGNIYIAAKQHDQVSKEHQDKQAAPAAHVGHPQPIQEELQEHNPKRQKQHDLDTVCSLTLQRLAACIQQSEQTQQQVIDDAVAREPNLMQTLSAPKAVLPLPGGGEGKQPIQVIAADDDTDEDAAALGLIMMLHSRENSDEEGPQLKETLGTNKLAAKKAVERSLQQQQCYKRRHPTSSLQESPTIHSNTAAGRMRQAALETKGVGCVRGAVTGVSDGALLQHKLQVQAQANVNLQHVTEQHDTAVTLADPVNAAAQAALSAASVAAGTAWAAVQLLKHIHGLLQQQQQHGQGSAGDAAPTAPSAAGAGAAASTESASNLLPASLLAAAAAPWYPCQGNKGGLMLRRNGKLVARKLYCMQTGMTMSSAAAVSGRKRAENILVEHQQQQPVQLAKRPCFQQQAEAGNTAGNSVPTSEQAGVQLLLDAAAAGGIDAASSDVQQHSVKQLTDEEMLARMRQRQHKIPAHPMGDGSCQQATAQDGAATAAAVAPNSRPSRSRKAPAKLEDTVPTEAVLAGLNRSKPVVFKPVVYSQQQQQQHWQLHDRYSHLQQQRHACSFQQHLQLHDGSRLQHHQQQQSDTHVKDVRKLQQHQSERQQQPGKGVRGLPPGMSIIASLSTRQLNAALAAARATAAPVNDAVLNSSGIVAKPAMAAPVSLTAAEAAAAAPAASQAAASTGTPSGSTGDASVLSSGAAKQSGSGAAKQAGVVPAASAGEKQAGSRDVRATPAATAEVAEYNSPTAQGCAADGDTNRDSPTAVQKGDKSGAGSPAEASLRVRGAAAAEAGSMLATSPAGEFTVAAAAAAVKAGLKVPAAASTAAGFPWAKNPAWESAAAAAAAAAAVRASLRMPAATGAAAAGSMSAKHPAGELSTNTTAVSEDATPKIKRQLKPGKTKLQTKKSEPMIRNRSQMEVMLLEQQRIKVQEMLKRHRQRQQQLAAAAAGDRQMLTAASQDKQQEQRQPDQQEAGAAAQRQQAPKHAKRPWMSLAPQPASNPATAVLFAAASQRSMSPEAPVHAAGGAATVGRVFIVPAAAVVPSAAAAVMGAGKPQTAFAAAQLSNTPAEAAPIAGPAAPGAPGRTVLSQAPGDAIPAAPTDRSGSAAAAASSSAAANVVPPTAHATAAAPARRQCAVTLATAAVASSTLQAAARLGSNQQKQQASSVACAANSTSIAAPQIRAAVPTASSLRAKLLAALSADDDDDNKAAAATAVQATAAQSKPTTGMPGHSAVTAAATADAQQSKGTTVAGPQSASMVDVGALRQRNGPAAAAAAKASTATQPTAVVLQRIPGSGLIGVPVYVPGMSSQQVVAHMQQQRHLLLASIQEQQRKQLANGTAALQQTSTTAAAVRPAPGGESNHQVPAGQ